MSATPTSPAPLALLLCAMLFAHADAATASGKPNGHRLLEECAAAVMAQAGAPLSAREARLASFCEGFVAGAAGVVAITEPMKPGGQLFCPGPDGIDPAAAVRMVHAYLLAHPERLHASRITLVTAAMMQAWPCPPADAAFHEEMMRRAAESEADDARAE